MKPVLVTGASGFLGWHIARLLIERGYTVRALCRPTSELRELEVERVTGDLRDSASLCRAAQGCGLVFHVAADYRLWSKDPNALYESNVEGTRNLLDAASSAGAERIIYTSTVGCIGMQNGSEGNESSPVSLADMNGHYKRSKWMAEQVALEKAKQGLPVVIVNPTAPVGDHDWKPTPTGKIIVDFLCGKLPAYVDTGLNLVHARDIALGHLLAAEQGRIGERYILGSQNLTLKEILGRLAAITNKTAPTFQVPYALAYLSGIASTALAVISGKPPFVPLEGVVMARKRMFVSHRKASDELGYAPSPVDQALKDAVAWFRQYGYA